MRSFLQNIWIKLVALSLGLLLWFHVATNKTHTQRMTLPVAAVELKEGLALATSPPESLTVSVTATGKQLLLGAVRTESLRVNLSALKAGTHNVDLSPNNVNFSGGSELLYLLAVIAPTSFTAEIDQMGRVKVPIKPDVKVLPSDGFALGSSPACSPDQVFLRGPQTRISAITGLSTMYREISGVRQSQGLYLKVRQPGIAGVVAEPESVHVNIDIVAVKSRLFERIPVVVYHAPAQEGIKVVPSTVNLEITGPPSSIDLLNRNTLAASVDFRRLSRNGYGAISVDCPAGFSVKQTSADSALVVKGN